MKKILILILFCGFGLSTYVFGQSPSRVQATPYPIKVVQPNGDTITIRLFGDERKHYFTSIDGYVIVKNVPATRSFLSSRCLYLSSRSSSSRSPSGRSR